MNTLSWKLSRLRTMGPAEVAHRARQTVQAQVERLGFGLAAPGIESNDQTGHSWITPLATKVIATPYLDAAERILSGRFDVFALEGVLLGFPPDWNRDPKTGARAPVTFGKTLDYRDERIVGDIKHLWEPNRHLELVTLAQAWRLTGRDRYAAGCRRLIESWLEQCPYPNGPNWTSSLEVGIRLVNWSVAWHLTGGEESALFGQEGGAEFRQRWLRSVYEHCHFISGHLSLHSSANNHLLGECMGLLVGSITWPLWRESPRWLDRASRRFEGEALKQNAPDGVNRESAIYYQHEVIEMMLLCGLVCRANGVDMSGAYWQRLEKMLEFVAAVMDCSGNVPMIGDSDDAIIVRFDPAKPLHVYRSALATGAVLFSRADFAARALACDDKTRWLLGDSAGERFNALLDEAGATAQGMEPRRCFPEGGYWVLGDAFDTPREIRIVADAGPLGYLSIAAHGHADALAFTLSVGGHELLVDPGTYAYHTRELWRNYFRGTSAHNTVRVDAADQSVAGGNFLWLHHADAVCELFETSVHEDRWIATHDGYRRLCDPVVHRRELVLRKSQRTLLVHDRLLCSGAHDVEVLWHFAVDCRVDVNAGVVIVRKGPITLRMSTSRSDFMCECVRGREQPPLGWISRRFDVKEPSPTVRWTGRVAAGAEWTTTIRIEIAD